MNHQDAAKVLAVLAKAFRHEIDEPTAELWFQSCLERVPVEVATKAVERLVAEDEWFPSIARFNAVRRAVERGMVEPHRALPAAPVEPSERERVKKMISDLHEKLR